MAEDAHKLAGSPRERGSFVPMVPMRQLFIPACLCLVTVGATTIGPPVPWPIEPIATSTYAKNKTKTNKTRRKAKPSARQAASTAAGRKIEPATGPAATFAARFMPFAAALQASQTPPAEPPRAAAYAAVAPSDDAADEPANPLAAGAALQALIPMSPPPGTPASVRKKVVYRTEREICDTIAKAAQSNNLPVPFFIRLLFQESKFNAASVSHAGAQGIAQFMPGTAADVGLDNPFDPLQAIPAAARLLRDFVDQFGNLGLAAAAYNAGPTRVHRWLKRQIALPAETRGYVKTITGQPAETWKAATAQGSSRLPQKAPCKDESGLYAFNGGERIPLPPQPSAPAVRTVHAATAKAPPKQVAIVAAADVHARPQAKTALQLAARRRGSKTRH